MILNFKRMAVFICGIFLTICSCFVNAEDIVIISGYSYDEKGPHIVFYNIDKKEYRKQYFNQEPVHITKLDTRYCIGTFDLDTFEYAPCPHKNKLALDSKINNCDDCYYKTGFNPSFYNAAQISPQQLEYNKTPHIVYLAYFSPTCVKVGIASEKRALLRLLEQGAKAAFVLKTFSNAYQARELEAKIAYGGYGILEGVTEKQKIDAFCSVKYDPKIAVETLTKFLQLLKITPESSFLDLYLKYFYGNSFTFPYPDKSRITTRQISGETIGMLGDMVIIRQKDRYFPIVKSFPIPIKKFISYQVNI